MKSKIETKQQIQLSNLLFTALNEVFLKLNLKIIEGKMITIYKVSVTQNLFEARILINVFPNSEAITILEKIHEKSWEIKKALVDKIKYKVRTIPQINFFIDDSIEHLFKMEKLFQEISK